MSYELLQSHLESTLVGLSNTKNGKSGSKKKSQEKQIVAYKTATKTSNPVKKQRKLKLSHIEKAEKDIKKQGAKVKQLIKNLASESSVRKHSIGDIMRIVKLNQKR